MAKTMAEWKIGDPMINENDYWQDPNYVAEDPEKEKEESLKAARILERIQAMCEAAMLTGKDRRKSF